MGISPSESGGAPLPPRLDTSTAHSARVWNYLLGGKDNFAADREVGDMILQMFPGIAHIAREIARFFDGLTLVPPGVVTTSRWRLDLADASAEPREVDAICGVARQD